MLREQPQTRQTGRASPEIEPYILTFWKNKIDLTTDYQLKQLNTPLWYAASLLAHL